MSTPRTPGQLADAIDALTMDVAHHSQQLATTLGNIAHQLRQLTDTDTPAPERGVGRVYSSPERAIIAEDINDSLVAWDSEAAYDGYDEGYGYHQDWRDAWHEDMSSMLYALHETAKVQPDEEALTLIDAALNRLEEVVSYVDPELEEECLADSAEMFISELIDTHLHTFTRLEPTPDQARRIELAQWLADKVTAPATAAYAKKLPSYVPALSPAGVTHLVARMAEHLDSAHDPYLARQVAILTGDVDALLAADSEHSSMYESEETLRGLLAAKHPSAARQYGEHFLGRLPSHPGNSRMGSDIIQAARLEGDPDTIWRITRAVFAQQPDAVHHEYLLEAAEELSGPERAEADTYIQGEAEDVFARTNPRSFIDVLLGQGRGEDAWAVAHTTRVPLDQAQWCRVCEAYAPIDAAATQPIYQRLIDDLLTKADKRNYYAARTILVSMRDSAAHGGPEVTTQFAEYVAGLRRTYARRLAMLAIFDEVGL